MILTQALNPWRPHTLDVERHHGNSGRTEIIDFITRDRQAKTDNSLLESDRSEAWMRWFQAADGLESTPETAPTALTSEYQQHLLSKYRQQGLDL